MFESPEKEVVSPEVLLTHMINSGKLNNIEQAAKARELFNANPELKISRTFQETVALRMRDVLEKTLHETATPEIIAAEKSELILLEEIFKKTFQHDQM